MDHETALPPVTLRERKKLRTRLELESVSLKLFAERGYDAVTIDDIAEAVQVSPRTFFRYFPTKEEVLFAEGDARLRGVAVELSCRPDDEAPLTALRRAVLSVAGDYEDEADTLFARASIIASTPGLQAHSLGRQALWEEELARSLAARMGSDTETDPRPRLIAGCAIVALRVAVSVWMVGGGTASLPDLVSYALDALERGLGRGGA